MGEQVAVEGGVLLEQRLEVERALGGDELVQPDLVRGDRRPLLLDVAVVGVRANVPDALENHLVRVVNDRPGARGGRHRYDSVYDRARDPPRRRSRPRRSRRGRAGDRDGLHLRRAGDRARRAGGGRHPGARRRRSGSRSACSTGTAWSPGATGTGKTKTLQLMAEQISAAGVPGLRRRHQGRPVRHRLAGPAQRQAAGAHGEARPGLAARRAARPSSSRWAARASASRCAPR